MKAICPKCRGIGMQPDMTERIFTFGFSWLLDKLIPTFIGWEICHVCNGSGLIKLRKHNP